MRVVLAEKPSVARELAAFLGASTRGEGYLEGRGYQVTWALGHLVTLQEPQDYDPALKRWSLSTLPIIPERFGLKVIDEKGARQQFAIVRRLLQSADEIIAATDAGREGELIFRYILELSGCQDKPARRLWLSSLTREAIREAFDRLRPLSDYDRLYDAARCRSESDWIVGLNATRYYTVRYRSGGQLWSVGRVQTPVLALIVHRDDEIRGFRPEPFWELLTEFRKVRFRFAGDRFLKEEDAQEILSRIEGHPFTIQGVDRKPERAAPPQLYDLTELQREMNRRFGLSAEATLKAAQSLYEAKLISYPRTDSRYLGRDIRGKIPGILEKLRDLRPEEIGRLELNALPFSGRIINDARVSDHHAIIPTGRAPGSLDSTRRKVFDAILIRLIAAFYPTCIKEVTTVSGISNSIPFRARGVRIVEPGWTVLYPRQSERKSEDAQELPAFQVGETGPHKPWVRQGETSPPKPYTESSLLGAMETAGKLVDDEALKEALKERGLGTPATRAAIIETLLSRGYIHREKKTLIATDLGRYLVALVRDPSLKSAELTGDWESKLRDVERDRLDPKAFMAAIADYTRAVLHAGETPIDPNQLGPCPFCQRPVIAGKRDFGCSGWRAGCPFVLKREFQGRMLDEPQVRRLLQHRILLPDEADAPGALVIQLLDNGRLDAFPVPKGEPRRTTSGPSHRRAKSGGRAGRATPRHSARSRPKAGSPVNSAPAVLGSCPLCGAEVIEQPKSFSCSAWRQGCQFTIWKTVAGKRISARTARALLKQGKSNLLKGFTSRSGKPFEARLKLIDGEVRFDFGD